MILSILVLVGCGTLETYENAKTIGSNIRSMMSMRDVAISLERYRAQHGSYPTSDSMVSLRAAMGPSLASAGVDRWGHELLVSVTPESYVLTSKGEDGRGDHEHEGAVTTPGHSITLKGGRFVQYFAKVEKTAVKLEQEIAAARPDGSQVGSIPR